MDAAVNGVISTGDQEIKLRNGTTQIRSAAERSLQIRRSQAKDRAELTNQIEKAQARIVALQEERAPIAAEVRKVEAEVGPIKYIASFIYGENPDANLLEKAVTWVIILIVIVFDPLAVMLLLASQYSFGLLKRKPEEDTEEDVEEWFRQGRERARELDADAKLNEEFADPPIPSFLLKKDIDLDAINQELTDARVEPTIDYSIIDDTEEELDEPPFKGKGSPPAMPMGTPYQYAEVEEESTSTINIIHTADSMIVEDTAGTQEIPAYNIDELTSIITVHGYSLEHGMVRSNGIEFPVSVLDKIINSGYVQNEEQKESDQWTKIVNKTITEEEYLKAVQQKKDA
jgi:hypothetical protein